VTDEDFIQILALAHELRGVEFKSPGPISNGRLIAQVVKAMLGMCNRRDGGTVIIGVEDNQGVLNQVGLSETDLAEWNYDAVADQVARYADPSVSFALEAKEYQGNSYVVLEVEEFADIPVLCKRSYDDVLRDGACYVRTRRKPETSDIPTQADMRDLLDLAIEKGVTQFLERARRVGLFSTPTVESPATDQELFDEQLGDLR
jgi:predicted HTH transcriptional regulator